MHITMWKNTDLAKKVDVYLPLMVMHMPYRRRYVSLSHEGYSVLCVRLVL